MITLSSVNKQSTTDNSDNDKNNHINFAGVKFSYPLSSHIRRLGINTALPIQEAAIRYYYYHYYIFYDYYYHYYIIILLLL